MKLLSVISVTMVCIGSKMTKLLMAIYSQSYSYKNLTQLVCLWNWEKFITMGKIFRLSPVMSHTACGPAGDR